ncbi:2-amino-4-hydroxy-6-hydroxymethyldihydropteridine diphosphokinase [Luteibaculum oceani]|uniref:2-amino-4-hydroxy-6- hydroxymethyldihydropteridine diphosphokinase n=1 Tax=Luteibaculum oceani TaxID=1294296 RepID=UPI0014775560|nr:2-amino-4-hydroxy-6-hydroxymethyldihydropteridine diphosphokinase [Luteibaculum oceani]
MSRISRILHENRFLVHSGYSDFTREALKNAERLENDIYVLLVGANLNDPKQQISEALKRFKKEINGSVIVSSLFRSEAWGFDSELYFLNQVWICRSEKSPLTMLNFIKGIEHEMGRVKTQSERYESRLIDIDILFKGNSVIDFPELQIPHPLIYKRKFTTVPLSELIPNFNHPVLNQKMFQLNDVLTDQVDRLED